MADSNQRPCKVSYNGSLRRFLIARPAIWLDFENKIRTVYSIPGNLALDVQYKDDEGDLITLNTDSELDDVLAMHTIFTPLAPVKFDVVARGQSMFPSMDSFSTRASSVVDDDDIHSQTAPSQMSNSIYGSYHSDDVSLIDLEEERDEHETESRQPEEEEALTLTASVAETLEQSISYPQQDLEDAARLQKEVDRLEALKLDAPIFTSSLLGAGVEDARDNVHDIKQSVSSSVSTLTAEFQDTIAENTLDAFESTASRPEREVQEEQEVIIEERKVEIETASAASESESFPTTSTASTSTSEHRSLNDDSALIEQFQLLIKEFQEIIQNNPQLVALAGVIMNKILSNVKVNVESFANYLHAQAQVAAQNSQRSAAEASAQLQEAAARAATHAQEAAAKAAAQAQEVAVNAGLRAQEAAAQMHRAATQMQEATTAPQPQEHQRPLFPQHPHHPQHPRHRGAFKPFFSHHHGFQGHGQHNHALNTLFGQSAGQPPMAPVASVAPMAPLLRTRSIPRIPVVPQMASFGAPPQAPTSHSGSSSSTSSSLGRSNTIHSSKPSPFSCGFPFNSTFPANHANTTFKSDRPVAGDTEASSSSSPTQTEKGKAVDTNTQPHEQGSPSSMMPGSFPGQPQMSELKPGWSWARLPDDGPEHVQPPSTRAKYGWVWNDAGGEKAEIVENQAPVSTLYGNLDTTEPTTPGSFPQSSTSATEKLHRRQTIHQFGRTAPTETRMQALTEASEHFEQQQHVLNEHRQSIAAAAQEGQRRVLDQAALQIEEQRKAMKAQQKAIEEQRQALEVLRQEQAQQRLDRLTSRVRPLSHSASMGHRPVRLQDQGRANSWYSTGSSTTISTPGDFPTVSRPRAPAPVVVNSTVPTPVTVSAPVPISAPAPAPALVPIQAPAPVQIPDLVQAPVPVQSPVPAPAPAPVSAPVEDVNPFADPSEFELEIQMLVSMGFPNTPELHTIVRDFGGEVEAVVEHLISQ